MRWDFLEIDAVGAFVLAQELYGRRAGRRGDVFPVQLPDGGDARVGLDRDPYFLDEGGYGEGDVLLTSGVIRRRSALYVDGAVLHQWDAVLRGDRLELDVHLGHA